MICFLIASRDILIRLGATQQFNFSMSTEDGASTKRHKAAALLGQLREGGGGEGGEEGGTEGWEEVRDGLDCRMQPTIAQ